MYCDDATAGHVHPCPAFYFDGLGSRSATLHVQSDMSTYTPFLDFDLVS